ncbi:MAG: tetratricopeptide repeat protein [Myxococcota bacterium]
MSGSEISESTFGAPAVPHPGATAGSISADSILFSRDLPGLAEPGSPVEEATFPALGDQDAVRDLLELYEREATALGDTRKAASIYLEIGRLHEEHLGQARQAADYYQRAYELDPHDPSVLHACRRLFTLAGQWDMVAAMIAEEAEAVSSPERKATLHAERGQILEEKVRQNEDAVSAYQAALTHWPAEPLAMAALERIYLFEHKYEDLYEVYEAALGTARAPERRLPILVSAAQLAEDRLDRPDPAIRHYQEVLQIEPGSAIALAALRRLNHRAERWDDFVSVLLLSADVAEDSESSALFLTSAARVQNERLNQPDRALMSLLQALEYTPNDLGILRDIEALYEKNLRFEDVSKVLKRELEIANESRERVSVLFKLGSLLEEQLGRPEEALPCYSEAVRLMPTHVPARQSLGRLYGRTNRWSELGELFEMEIRLEEDDAGKVSKLYKLAELRDVKLGQEEGAISALRELLALKPDYQPARKYVERLLQRREDWTGLVELYNEEFDYTQDPEQRVFLLGRIGVIAEEKANDLIRAQQAYERILTISPKHLTAIRTLSRIAAKREDWVEVLRMYELEVEATDDQAEIVATVHRAGVVTEERLQDVDGALAHYEKALSLNPSYLPGLRSLGRIYARQGRWSDLVGMYQRELEVTRSPEQKVALLFRIADAHQDNLDDDSAAVEALNEVLVLDPENLPALRELAQIHERTEDGEALVSVLLKEAHLQRDSKEKAAKLMRVAELCEERLDRSDRAAELYEDVLRLGYGLDPAIRSLIRIYSAEGMWNALSRALKTAFDHARDDASRAAILVRCSEVSGDRLHNLDSAADHLEQALTYAPDNLSILNQLERVSVARRDWRRACQLIERLAERESDPRLFAARQIQLAQIKELQLDPPESGAEHYRRALERVPDHPVALRAMEIAYLKAQNWEGLAKFFQREAMLSEELPRQATLCSRAGEIATTRLGDDAFATDMFRRALEADPQCLPALRGRRRLAESAHDAPTVLTCLQAEEAATSDKEHARDLLFEIGRLYQDKFKDVDAALHAFQGVLERSPDHEPAFRRLEAIFLERGADQALVDLYAARAGAVEEAEVQAKLLSEAGLVAHDRLGRIELAMSLFQQVLERDKMHPLALMRLGPLHFDRSEWDEAIDVFHRTLAVTKDPEVLLRSFRSLGIIYQEHRVDLVKSVQSFQAALQVEPKEVECLRRLSAVYREAEDWPSAINVLLRLTEVTTALDEKVNSLLQLGGLYENGTKEPGNAILAYRKLLELDPSNQDAILRLCNLYETREDWPALAEVTSMYVRTLPPDQKHKALPLHLKVADVFENRLGDDDRAIQSLRMALEARPRDDEALKRLARLFSKNPETYPQAIDAHRRLLWNDPFRMDSYHHMFQLFEKRNEHDKALVIAEILVYLRAVDEAEQMFWDEHRDKVASRADGRLSTKDHWRLVVHPGERTPLREAFEVLGFELGKIFPGDLARFELNPRTDRHGPKSDQPTRRLADELAEVINAPPFDLWVSPRHDLEVFIENDKPPALVVGGDFGRRLKDEDQRFLLGRQLERLKGGHQLLDMLSPRDAEAMIGAVAALTNSPARHQADPSAVDSMVRRVARGLSARGKKILEDLAPRLFAAPVDVSKHRQAAIHTAIRAGLVLNNNIQSCVRNLAKDHPDIRPVFRDAEGAAETIGQIQEVRELLAFAISEEYFAARARLRFSIQS